MYIMTHQSDTTKHVFNVKLISNQSCLIILLYFFSLLVKLLLALLWIPKLEDEESSAAHYPHSVEHPLRCHHPEWR